MTNTQDLSELFRVLGMLEVASETADTATLRAIEMAMTSIREIIAAHRNKSAT